MFVRDVWGKGIAWIEVAVKSIGSDSPALVDPLAMVVTDKKPPLAINPLILDFAIGAPSSRQHVGRCWWRRDHDPASGVRSLGDTRSLLRCRLRFKRLAGLGRPASHAARRLGNH